MDRRLGRLGFRIGRVPALLLLLVGAVVLVAVWLGPLRPLPARIELLALDSASATATAVRTPDGTLAFVLPIGVRNLGDRTARPRRVALSVPAHFGIATPRGRLSGVVTSGLSLRRFVVELPTPTLPPDSAARRLPELDTLYIEPDLPRYYCVTQGLGVPEFIAAPRFDAQTLSDLRIFYSFIDASGPERHTGVLAIELDPERLAVAPAPSPPVFPTVVELPEAPAPDVGPLAFAGVRRAHCGDPERPVELYTVLWETRAGGRVFVLYTDNVGRKRLYDLNRDGVIELETWDNDADGRFEARRDARFAIPAFLMPIPPRDPSLTAPDPVKPDSAWLALFRNYAGGPHRFARSRLTAHPQPLIVDTTADPATGRTALGPLPPGDSAFIALFNDTAAGPFRFSRQQVARAPRPSERPDSTRQVRPAATRPSPPAGRPAEVTPEPEPEPEPAPVQPPKPRKEPLGTPVGH